jgi:D-alanine-D-alanine ligase-like ATP-grasp enzyme
MLRCDAGAQRTLDNVSRSLAAERLARELKAVGTLSAAEYVRAAARAGIGPKSALIEHAAIARGLATTRLSSMEVLIEVPGDAAPSIYFHQMNGPRSLAGRFYCDDKTVARDVLRRAGLNVATSQAFGPGELREGLRYADNIGYPVVVKPTNLARGIGVTANIQTPQALVRAWRRARTASSGWFDKAATVARSLREISGPRSARGLPAHAAAYRDVIRRASSTAWQSRWRPVLVEKHFEGNDFRAFVVGDNIVSVTQRKAANVVGDGVATVRELIERKNAIRADNISLYNCPIPTRLESLDLLAGAGLTMSHVPASGEIVVLRSACNLSAGGDSIDVTAEAHPGFIDVAIRAVRAIPGMPYAGVDLITPDITIPPTATNHIVSEIEYSPCPTVAHFPLIGTPRDMAGAVLEYYLEHGAAD